MAQCKWCNKKGFFVFVYEYGLCKKCSVFILSQKQQYDRIISDSLGIIEKTKKLDTALSRYDFIIKKLEEFLPYYRNGINLYGNDLIDSIQQVRYGKNESILDILTKQKHTILEKILILKTENSKNKNIQKFNESINNSHTYLEMGADNYDDIKAKIELLKIQ